METLLLIMIALYLVGLISLVLLVRQYSKTQVCEDPVPAPDEDYYEEYDFCERPYVNYN